MSVFHDPGATPPQRRGRVLILAGGFGANPPPIGQSPMGPPSRLRRRLARFARWRRVPRRRGAGGPAARARALRSLAAFHRFATAAAGGSRSRFALARRLSPIRHGCRPRLPLALCARWPPLTDSPPRSAARARWPPLTDSPPRSAARARALRSLAASHRFATAAAGGSRSRFALAGRLHRFATPLGGCRSAAARFALYRAGEASLGSWGSPGRDLQGGITGGRLTSILKEGAFKNGGDDGCHGGGSASIRRSRGWHGCRY